MNKQWSDENENLEDAIQNVRIGHSKAHESRITKTKTFKITGV